MNHFVNGAHPGTQVYVDPTKLPTLYRPADGSPGYCQVDGSALRYGCLYKDKNGGVWRAIHANGIEWAGTVKAKLVDNLQKNKYGLQTTTTTNKPVEVPRRTLNILDVATLSTPVVELAAMLRYRRPAGSRTERKFIAEYITPLGPELDAKGNLYFRIGTKEEATIMWSCHTDTVHRAGGKQDLVLAEVTEPNKTEKLDGRWFVLDPKSSSNCLGTDDTVGVWLMVNMIRAKVPGLYVFHRGEEIGCIGSGYAASTAMALEKAGKEHPFQGIRACIAFDRRHCTDIITHQRGQRCCSDAFAKSFAAQLGVGSDLKYSPARGIYTDSAEYTDLIGECTNVSVGYLHEHSRDEMVQIEHAIALRDRLCQGIDWTQVTFERKPGESGYDVDDFNYGYVGKRGHKRNGGASEDWSTTISRWRSFRGQEHEEDEAQGQAYGQGPGGARRPSSRLNDRDFQDMVEMVKDNPRIVAEWFEHHGYDTKEFGLIIDDYGGTLRPYMRRELDLP